MRSRAAIFKIICLGAYNRKEVVLSVERSSYGVGTRNLEGHTCERSSNKWQGVLEWREIICLLGCSWQTGSSSSCSKIPDNPPHIFLIFGNEQSFSKLSNFLSFCGFILTPPPIQFLSWIFQDLVSLIQSVYFPRLDSTHLHQHFDSYCACPNVLLHHLVSTLHVFTSPCAILASTAYAPSKGISPGVFIPPLVIPVYD